MHRYAEIPHISPKMLDPFMQVDREIATNYI